MGKVVDQVSQRTLRQRHLCCGTLWRYSPNLSLCGSPADSPRCRRSGAGKLDRRDLSKITAVIAESNRFPGYNSGREEHKSTRKWPQKFCSEQLDPAGLWVPSDCTLPVIGTLPDHFAKSVRLARNSQHSRLEASESQIRATGMLQDAAGVANCNTYNRNQTIRELRKGLFFRGRCHGAGIDSTSESFRTAFQTIYDLTGIHTAGDCRMHAIEISDNPRHAPSVQC